MVTRSTTARGTVADDSVDKTELADERTELAEERTEWADQRTYLAQERTFGGWVRTGLTSIAVGLGVVELLREVEPQWLITAIGVVFIAVGGLIQVLAFFSYHNVRLEMKKTDRPEMSISIWWIGIITAGLTAAAIGGLAVVFL